MSLKTLMLLVVVAISMQPSASSPTISFEAIGREKDNVIKALGGLKSQLLSPFAGIARWIMTLRRRNLSECFAEASLGW